MGLFNKAKELINHIAYRIVVLRSNSISPDPRVEKVAKCLADDGKSVTIVAWDRSGELPHTDTINGVRLIRLSIHAKYGSGLANLPSLLRWQVGLLIWLIINRREYDIIHACDFDTVLPALFIKTLNKKSVVYDIFDFYADHLRKTPEFLKRLIRRLDFVAIGSVDGVILADESRKGQIEGSKPKRLTVIYNTPIDVRDQIRTTDSEADQCQLRIAYIGLLQVERGLLELLDVLAKQPEWRLDLAGFGGDEKKNPNHLQGPNECLLARSHSV